MHHMNKWKKRSFRINTKWFDLTIHIHYSYKIPTSSCKSQHFKICVMTEIRYICQNVISNYDAKVVTNVNEKCCLPHQQTNDTVVMKPSVTTTPEGVSWENWRWRPMGYLLPNQQPLQPPCNVHPEGTQDGKAQGTGPRYLRCISKA